MSALKLGACLADDMGLGKTVQVIALLLNMKSQPPRGQPKPSLLIVPASLIANWKSEISRFAPSLTWRVVHPSENGHEVQNESASLHDLVISTYGMLTRHLAARDEWNLIVLDEIGKRSKTPARGRRGASNSSKGRPASP